MSSKGIKYKFIANCWQHEGPGGWTFVTVPKEISKEIRAHLKKEEEGWGEIKSDGRNWQNGVGYSYLV